MNKTINMKIEQAHQEWIAALDAVEYPIFIHDRKFRILRCNLAYQQHAGQPFQEIIGRPYYELFPKSIGPMRHCLEALEHPTDKGSEEEVQVDEKIFFSRGVIINDEQGNYLYSLHILKDITEQRRIEEALRTSEEKFRALVESTSDWIWEINAKGIYTYVSPRVEELLGYKPEELLGKSPFELMPPAEVQRIGDEVQKLITERAPLIALQNTNRCKDGTLKTLETSGVPFFDERGIFSGYRGIDRDITERIQAELNLCESDLRYRTLFETMLNGFAYCQMIYEEGLPVDFIYLDVNKAFEQQTGLKNVIGKRVSEVIPGIRESDPVLFERYARVASGGKPEQFEIYVQSLEMWFFISIYSPQPEKFIAIFDVITERKKAEEALHRANRALKTLSAGNLALVRATSEDMLLQTVTNVIVEKGGYRLATVCYAQDDQEKSITTMAWSGVEDSYFGEGNLSWGDNDQGQLPISKAIRNTATQICRDIVNDPYFNPWREAVLARGYVSNIALPLFGGGRTFGALSIYSSEANTFNEEEVRLLEELANDLAYGIITLRTRLAHEQQAAILRESLEQSIQTIASTVEMRDPYTAGHQRRVGELATAIGQEMGLPEEQVHGLHLAAIIHDLGKIQVPAEILSKPGKLSGPELMLIQTHPQAGYDILKEVKFPWPIADIILQHHEKLDGSGYPQGLKGDQILLEAKIITVADVVEAISSRRPYRSSLGIEVALNEIIHGRGRVYDPAVVDACLKLFTEKGFVFSSESM